MSQVFPERLKHLRLEQQMTQKAIADALGIGQTTVANYEKGVRLPDLAMIARIADYFAVSVDYLLGREHKRKQAMYRSNELTAVHDQYHSFDDYMEALLSIDKPHLQTIITALFEEGIDLGDFYHNYVARALYQTGDLWEQGDLAVWKEHYISEILLEHIAMMKGRLQPELYDIPPVLALVPSGTHTIGLRIISNLLEAKGFPVIYLGSNVPADNVLAVLELHRCETILMSVTMPYDINATKHLIETIRHGRGENSPRILIGGQGFRFLDDPVQECGADALCDDVADIMSQLTAASGIKQNED